MNDKEIEMIKKKYPKGTRIKLINMKEEDYPIPNGSQGTVDFVDGLGTVHMVWDNGRTLALIYGVDKFEIIKSKDKER